MIRDISNINSIYKYYKSYNHTLSAKKKILSPKNINELKNIILYLKSQKEKVLIRTGNCGQGDKTKLSLSNYVISLKNLNKIKKINKKRNTINIEAGANLYKIFKYLEKKDFKTFNIPGGKNVSLGGAISGNVHGRPTISAYSVFGDNVISLKILNDDGKIVILNRKKKQFFKVIGGLSLFGIILEAEIKIFKLEKINYNLNHYQINSKKEFNALDKNTKVFYGYINFFNKNRLQGNFMTIKKDEENNKNAKNKNDIFFRSINILKIDTVLSFFINNFTIRIFYYLLFKFTQYFSLNKQELINFERNIYFVNINTFLPSYFRKGMIEIQFSVPSKNIIKLIEQIKSLQFKHAVFPFFYILKKMKKIKKKYIFGFPKYNHCISLGFSKHTYLKNKVFFKLLYKLIYRNHGNLYVTKDETFLYNNPPKQLINSLKRSLDSNKVISSDFREKLFNL
jgi:hypothetical protein